MSHLLSKPGLALLAFHLVVCSQQAFSLDVGDRVPNFSLQGQDHPLASSDFSGKVVYLDYWASWCGPCRQSFPWLNDMQTKYGPKGLQVVAINLDSKTEDATRFLEKYPAAFAVAFDPQGQTPRQFGVKGMPSSFLIGKNGSVLAKHTGFRESDQAALEKNIQNALEN